MTKPAGEIVQQLFHSEPATYALGSDTGEEFWNVTELMGIVKEKHDTKEEMFLFLCRFEALAPRRPSANAISDDSYDYDRSIKRRGDGDKVTGLTMANLRVADIEKDLKSIFINKTWGKRILQAKRLTGVSAMEIEESPSVFRKRTIYQAKVLKADGTYVRM
jgi:hypothetical protein